MQDLNKIYVDNQMKKTFLNFFKSTYYKDAVAFLTQEGLPPEEIIQRTRPYRGHAATCMVHDLVALAFRQWENGVEFNRILMRITA